MADWLIYWSVNVYNYEESMYMYVWLILSVISYIEECEGLNRWGLDFS